MKMQMWNISNVKKGDHLETWLKKNFISQSHDFIAGASHEFTLRARPLRELKSSIQQLFFKGQKVET